MSAADRSDDSPLARDLAAAAAFAWPRPRSAYVHVPFCRHRCGYCNFSILPGRLDVADQYLQAIQAELDQLDQPAPIDTLFIGGGTPTRLPLDQLSQLFRMVAERLPLAAGGECTVEANPEDIDRRLLDGLRDHGVNRISLGVQSFADTKLQQLERGHNRDSATNAIQLAAEVIGNVSIDLIFSAPGETPAAWRDDLQHALTLPIQHLSCYALTYEKGTPFWSRRLKGQLTPTGEESELEMYQDTLRLTAQAGWEHYEISNFARPGFRCAHNQAYWRGAGWYAFGPAAARFVQGRREVNHRSPTTYIRRLRGGQSVIAESEPLTLQQFACERAAFGIRMLDGVDLHAIALDTGVDVQQLRREEIAACQQAGWLESPAGGHWRLTPAGLLMADSVAAAFL